MTFYTVRFIPKRVAIKKTLRVSRRGTPSFQTPLVTDVGEDARQKILIRQVFDRCVVVRARQEGLFGTPPTPPLPWEDLEGVLRKGPFLKKEKFFEKTGETPSVSLCDGMSQDRG